MSKRKKLLSLLAAGKALALALAGCGTKVADTIDTTDTTGTGGAGGDAAPAGDIKIGLTISLSGGTADTGPGGQRGRRNGSGRVQQGKKSVQTVQRLINQDRVIAFLGPANTGSAKGAHPVATPWPLSWRRS